MSTPPVRIEKLLYTPQEAAKALGISRSKIYTLMAAGQLESVRVGGSRRIPTDSIHAFIETLRDLAVISDQ